MSYEPLVTYSYLNHPVNYCCCLSVFFNSGTIIGLFWCSEVSPILQVISKIKYVLPYTLVFLDAKSDF